ncbi:MAG TPA: hypothetical protein VK420_14425, partial [Longimicrobium sp.]|nr:hypothetical protein [Longimicrobium sp.]
METSLGVKEIIGYSLSKRDFLLFDRMLVPYLEYNLENTVDPSERADLEWLIHEGMLDSVEVKRIVHGATGRKAVMLGLYQTLGLVVSNPELFAPTVKLAPEVLRGALAITVTGLMTRLSAGVVEDTLGVRATPLITDSPQLPYFEPFTTGRSLTPAIGKVL